MATLYFDKEGRNKLKAGVDKVADAVKVTLGAKGRNVTIERTLLYPPGGVRTPIITKDGVTVARAINQLSDPVENLGALMVKDAAEKTMALAGDGTTTSTLLAQAIFSEGLKQIENGANPMDLKKGIDRAVAIAVESIRGQAMQIGSDRKRLHEVAKISANGDEIIANIVADTFSAVGKDGYVTYAKTPRTDITIEMSEGMKIDRGYVSSYFVTNKEKATVELEDAYILIYDKKISRLADIVAILENIVKNNKSLLIIAEEIEGEALYTLTANAVQKNQKFCAIRHPFGGNEVLEDIAAITGATVVSDKKGHSWNTFNMAYLGRAQSIKVEVDSTLIVGGFGKKEYIEAYTKNLDARYHDESDEYDKAFLQKRLANISNSAAVIHIGGQTDTEMMERKDRIDDAVCAVRAAMQEGIVPGGGMAFLNASRSIPESVFGDEGKGVNIVKVCLLRPAVQIALNAGIDFYKLQERKPSSVDESFNPYPARKNHNDDFGYNVASGKWEYFFESGIIDPAKVSRVALENAASVASMLLTTECTIVG